MSPASTSPGPNSPGGDRPVLVVNPSPDVYGADLQMLQTVGALTTRGRRVVVLLPEDGPLVERVRAVGGEVAFLAYPVLRKGHASVGGLLRMLADAARAVPRAVGFLRRSRPGLLLVNTVTLPWWLLAGRLARVPTVGYLHEAETESGRLVRTVLVAPLALADTVIVISRSAMTSMTDVLPRLASRAQLIYNGVPQPPEPPQPAAQGTPYRFAVVGRLSPRKAQHVAIEALALLRADGLDVTLEVAGTAFAGYEGYEADLRARAARPELAGAVTFAGYCSPIWPVLQRADAVLAPSLREPFGNAVVEAQMSRRPVVASAALGHLESIDDDRTGLLVTPDDAAAMAAAMRRLVTEPGLASRLGEQAAAESVRRFSVERYGREVAELVDRVGVR